jgi:hypothetical protein
MVVEKRPGDRVQKDKYLGQYTHLDKNISIYINKYIDAIKILKKTHTKKTWVV